MSKRKYIFVTGGVMSGVGKGIASSSIGTILKARGLKVTALKIDPYINVDAGTMNPTEHGEVFVLNDGDETDQDMGNYERFMDVDLSRMNYMTTGRVYQTVIEKERNLEYKGKNVEVVPDIPLEVISRIERAADLAEADVAIVEIGGTIGEYQNIIFLEAARMMKTKLADDVIIIMLSYLPMPSKIGEMKTKPTQYASRTLNGVGLQADIIIARSELPLDQKRKDKIALFCNIKPENVISAPDVESIYDVPVNFERDNLGVIISKKLGLKNHIKTNLDSWKKFVSSSRNTKGEIKIAIVGKYFDSGDFVLGDVYISVIEAIKYSAYKEGRKAIIEYVNSKDVESGKYKVGDLAKYDGILVPGGFGKTGVAGKLEVIRFAREKKIPYLGICYGMQLMVIEYARNVLGWKDANTFEIDPASKHLVIDIMPDQKEKLKKANYGASMRLGGYPCQLNPGTIAFDAYADSQSPSYKLEAKSHKLINERHRHRYEVNPKYINELIKAGLVFSGVSPDGALMEIAELNTKDHPFFLGTQFHPEFLARPLNPHPLFTAFIISTLKK
ncbi:MAG: CTP synthase [Candidatus Taylorbacteria bacterium RIFCSPLOWO2_12_FULL_43_20]|uniref:CTP synthase n=1 Tax=Candidatus Taylorbacteria bacterium RIFCSPLOWO2_12_FULL_43_20 TaxID=1802332 RepID=A0A1G2NZ61_9BACT|nr:MAG: CTP synthase [Candidatus Taylorbacteria bacterium RIFCSPHIGHO2_01_FULL_43_120]OHA23784.1 MAG: CTP synthase [Candidatus Taylorbacteria bacterium RIFCSPHIGHO2_02_FULL_43_55]OHA30238.1 MAG: CTP synthase [Candidatus Taylorbacteria bacterium RIFCSPHIGHO2_12_FULL_42_34]OHA31988.1 MAG: CTP synthase [Candidatus Taylorbacteria bacterium RIFCSPLOWO2_01_FULL_43_83]OHA38011.1 MAG: CTP synthase [Candidatus Taylorbacteria bacterium RIFCSPLOWO2_02_FULL_43_22b]OHA41386.1 MAG: CTP synthase [Candidatus 